MIITTSNSRKLNFLLAIRNSACWNIGIIGDKWYNYTYAGAYCFDLRPDYMSDNHFPGIRSSKRKISLKYLLTLLTEKYLDEYLI